MNAIRLSDLKPVRVSNSSVPDWLMQCDGKSLIVRSFGLRAPLAFERTGCDITFAPIIPPRWELEVLCRLPDGDWKTVICRQIGDGSQFDLSEMITGMVIDIGQAPAAPT